MDKAQFIIAAVEAIVFLTPLITFIAKTASWRKETDMEISHLKEKVAKQESVAEKLSEQMSGMNNTLIVISTKLDLILESKKVETAEK